MFRILLTSLVAMILLTGPSSADGDYSGITIKRGYPLPADGDRLIENLKLNRAIELFLWSLPVNQSYAGRDGVRAASGRGDLDINYIGDFSDHRVGLSTLNNESIWTGASRSRSFQMSIFLLPTTTMRRTLVGFSQLACMWAQTPSS